MSDEPFAESVPRDCLSDCSSAEEEDGFATLEDVPGDAWDAVASWEDLEAKVRGTGGRRRELVGGGRCMGKMSIEWMLIDEERDRMTSADRKRAR